jgi:hypothetical protein
MDDRPRLGTAPGERYGSRSAETGDPRAADGWARAVTMAAAISLGGAVAIAVLGEVVGVGVGLVVAAAVIGWLIGASLRTAGAALTGRARVVVALALAVTSVLVGQLGLWLITLAEGSVLGPIPYLSAVFGLLVPLEIVAALVAGFRTAR